MNVIGFDYGSKLIGVAVGNRITRNARPIGILHNTQNGPEWNILEGWLKEWQPEVLVVGLPLTLDGAEQAASRAARNFAELLQRRYSLPVHAVDERMSSQEAARRFAARRASGQARRKQGASIDAVAAEVITETWLAENP
ncbi:MAG: Holliday junction resolvase RuvX [Tahibacter sp.]